MANETPNVAVGGSPAQRVTFAQVLRNQQFLLLWLAQFISGFGDWLALLAMFSLVAFRWKGTANQVGGIIVAYTVPVAVLGPLAGVFVDRWNLKRTLISSDMLRAAVAALFAAAASTGELFLLIGALSAVSCFFLPAQNAILPLLVRKEELLVANALNAQTIQFNKIVGPAIAGLLVAWAGERICFYLDAVSFLLSAALLAFLSYQRDASEKHGSVKALWGELKAGVHFLAGKRVLRLATLALTAALFIVGAFDALIAVYVRDVLASASSILGALVAVVGVGTIFSSALVVRYAQKVPRLLLVILGIGAMGVTLLIFAQAATPWLAVACGLGLGLTVGLVFVPSQTLMQEETPKEMLGRVGSTSLSLMTVAQLVGVSVASPLAAWLGIVRLYNLLGLAMALVGLLAYVYLRGHRLAGEWSVQG